MVRVPTGDAGGHLPGAEREQERRASEDLSATASEGRIPPPTCVSPETGWSRPAPVGGRAGLLCFDPGRPRWSSRLGGGERTVRVSHPRDGSRCTRREASDVTD